MCLNGGTDSDKPSAGGPSAGCGTATVTIAPDPIHICGTVTTVSATATGTPTGGTYAWTSNDTGVATVTGNGDTVTVKGVKAGQTTVNVTYTAPNCSPVSDTADVSVCTCTPGRKYANAKKAVAKLSGIRAKIKTRYGKLCCEKEGCSTDTGYHVVYVNISNTTGDVKWAQTGYGRERNAGSKAIKTYRYAEMNGTAYKVNYDTAHAPAEGTTHKYQCELDKSTGSWTFSYDGTDWQTFADPFWRNKTGTNLQYTGEIYNKEDDMPGTAADKCAFTDCQYCLDGKAYQNASLVAGNVGIPSPSHDASEWGEQWVSGTALNIWDKKPIP